MSVADNFADPSSLILCEGCVLSNIAPSFHSGVLCLQFLNSGCKILFADTFRSDVRGAASLQNNLVNVGPGFDISEFLSLGLTEIFGEFNFVSFLIQREEALRHNSCGVEDSSQSSAQ